MGAKRLGYEGETTRVENRGETTRGETTRGRNVLLPFTMDRYGKSENILMFYELINSLNT